MKIILAVVIFTIFAIGFYRNYRHYLKIKKKEDFTFDFREKFILLANSYSKNRHKSNSLNENEIEQFTWLLKNSNKIQNYVSTFGIVNYTPAFNNYTIKNYPLILNTIPKFRDGKIVEFEIESVDNCLIKYQGHLEDYIISIKKGLFNPIMCFREGIREILSIPVLFLSWFGIIDSKTRYTIKENLISKIISGIIALVVFISSIVTIIIGYDAVVEFVQKTMSK